MRKLSGRVGVLVACLYGLFLCATAEAQTPFVPAPIRPSVDGNGVDLRTGQLLFSKTDIAIGQPGAGRLSYGAGFMNLGNQSYLAGERQYVATVNTSADSTKTYFTVSLENYSERFEKLTIPSNSPIVSSEGKTSTLTQNATSYTYTTEDGLQAVFSKNITHVQENTAGAFITTLTQPDGDATTFNYVTATHCILSNCSITATIRRLQSITNNRGYQIKLLYQLNTATIPPDDKWAWYLKTGVIGVNMAVEYCDPLAGGCAGMTQTWPSVSYTYGSLTSFVTDAAGRVSSYEYVTSGTTGLAIRFPGSQTDDVFYTFKVPQGIEFIVTAVTRAGQTWSYNYTATATELTTEVIAPGNRQSIYVFSATTGSIISYRNPEFELTTYANDAKGRPELITLPTGETVQYTYDSTGRVTQTVRTAGPGGGTTQVLAAGYDTCTTTIAKWCRKPRWTRDPKLGQTDYTYANQHGGVLTVQLPAGGGGIRPTATNTYSQLAAYYYKNAPGSLVADTGIYYLTASSTCRTLATCANGADELRTVIGYGANSVPNNRLPVSSTIRNGTNTVSAVTAIGYDYFGNVTSVDGPLSGTADTTRTVYDSVGRVIGQISPDPDGAGVRPPNAVRTTYNVRGLPSTVESGTVPNQGTTMSGFMPLQTQTANYDSYGRPVGTFLAAGGSTFAAQQTSYDSLGRVDCTATRMNPAAFQDATPACSPSASGSFGPDRIVKYSYDGRDRVTSATTGFGQPDAIAAQTLSYTGDRLTAVFDGSGNKTSYEHDGFGRVLRVLYPDPVNVGSSSATDFEQFVYDVNSQIVSVRRRSGQVVGLTRDALNRVTVKDVPGGTADDVYMSYDNHGRVLWARKASTSGPGIDQTYDGLGRLLSRTVLGRTLSYQLDAAGRRTRLTYPDAFYVNYAYSNTNELLTVTDSTSTTLATYTFDTVNRMTGVTRPNSANTTFVPDTLGRLQTLTQNPSGTGFDSIVDLAYNPAGQIVSRSQSNDAAYTWMPPLPNSSVMEDVNGRNQLTQVGGTPVNSDADGNISSLNTYSYTFNALGQLVQATGGSTSTTVEYDPSGMLSKVTSGGTSTDYLYDGGDLVAQYNGATVLRKFVHGPGMDEPLVWYEGSGTSTRKYLFADERGSIITVSDNAGVASTAVKYSPYGESGALASVFGYTGQLYLPTVNAYYYKARMYSPETGRFLSPDPIGYADGMNLYGYVGGDPVNFVDPSGLALDQLDMILIEGLRHVPIPWCDQLCQAQLLGNFQDWLRDMYANEANAGSTGGATGDGGTGVGGDGGSQGPKQTWVCTRAGKATLSSGVGGMVTVGIMSRGNPLLTIIGGAVGGAVGFAGSELSDNPNVGPFVAGAIGAADGSPGAGGVSTFFSATMNSAGFPNHLSSTVGGGIYGAMTATSRYRHQIPAVKIEGAIKGGFAGLAGSLSAVGTAEFLNSKCD